MTGATCGRCLTKAEGKSNSELDRDDRSAPPFTVYAGRELAWKKKKSEGHERVEKIFPGESEIEI